MFVSDTPSAAEWASVNKSDHSSRAASILLVNGIFIGEVLLIACLRIFTKVFMTAKLFIDDYLMTGSVILFSAVCIINMYSVHLGSGSHVWDLPGITDHSTFEEVSKAAAPIEMLNYTSLVIIAPAIILAKLSIITILLRIFPESMRALRYFLFTLAAILTACCVTQALLVMFQCSPIQASWNIEAGDCYIQSLEAITMGLGVLNLFTDLMICVTPIPYFWQLNMPKPQRICLCALFMTGIFACAFSVVRVVSLRGLNNNLDITYVAIPYFNWSIVEAGLIIITGSVPYLRPLMATILPDFFKSCNFSSLAISGKSENASAGSSMVPSSYDIHGDITITKEFHLEETDVQYGHSFDPRLTGTPMTPLAPRSGPRMVVICEKVDS